MSKKFRIDWTEELSFCKEIEAESIEDARNRFLSGEVQYELDEAIDGKVLDDFEIEEVENGE